MGDSRERSKDELAAFKTLSFIRWPNGFVCPRCKSKDATLLETRLQYQCNECRFQCSVLTGTRLEGMRIRLDRILEGWAQFCSFFFNNKSHKLIPVRELMKALDTTSLGTATRFRKTFSDASRTSSKTDTPLTLMKKLLSSKSPAA